MVQAEQLFWRRKGVLMHDDHEAFVRAIEERKKIEVAYFQNEQNQCVTKSCVPVYYGPATLEGVSDCYHFWDAAAEPGECMLSLPPSRIRQMRLSDDAFDPANL
jgi:hypothetical protein